MEKTSVFLFDELGFFETHFAGKSHHGVHHSLAHLLRVSFQQFLDGSDVRHVFLVRLGTDAGTFAVLDVVLQADTEFVCLDVFGCEHQVAGA